MTTIEKIQTTREILDALLVDDRISLQERNDLETALNGYERHLDSEEEAA